MDDGIKASYRDRISGARRTKSKEKTFLLCHLSFNASENLERRHVSITRKTGTRDEKFVSRSRFYCRRRWISFSLTKKTVAIVSPSSVPIAGPLSMATAAGLSTSCLGRAGTLHTWRGSPVLTPSKHACFLLESDSRRKGRRQTGRQQVGRRL